MSFKRCHMSNPVGLRGPVKTVESAYNMYGNINTWKELESWMVTDQEYGWTKFSDAWLIACYLKASLILNTGSDLAGYQGSCGTRCSSLKNRALQFNIKNVLDVAKALIHQKLLSPGELKEILERPTRQHRGRGFRFTSLYAFWGWELVMCSLMESHSSEITATAFGVSIDVIEWWIGQDIVDPRPSEIKE